MPQQTERDRMILKPVFASHNRLFFCIRTSNNASGKRGAFCGYGVAVKNFKNPVIDFDRNNTYIQSEGINQDFGVYDSPDDLL